MPTPSRCSKRNWSALTKTCLAEKKMRTRETRNLLRQGSQALVHSKASVTSVVGMDTRQQHAQEATEETSKAVEVMVEDLEEDLVEEDAEAVEAEASPAIASTVE